MNLPRPLVHVPAAAGPPAPDASIANRGSRGDPAPAGGADHGPSPCPAPGHTPR